MWSISRRRVLQFRLSLFFLFKPFLLLLSCLPLVLSVPKSPQFHTLSNAHLVDPLQLQVGVYCVEKIKLVFDDKRIF